MDLCKKQWCLKYFQEAVRLGRDKYELSDQTMDVEALSKRTAPDFSEDKYTELKASSALQGFIHHLTHYFNKLHCPPGKNTTSCADMTQYANI